MFGGVFLGGGEADGLVLGLGGWSEGEGHAGAKGGEALEAVQGLKGELVAGGLVVGGVGGEFLGVAVDPGYGDGAGGCTGCTGCGVAIEDGEGFSLDSLQEGAQVSGVGDGLALRGLDHVGGEVLIEVALHGALCEAELSRYVPNGGAGYEGLVDRFSLGVTADGAAAGHHG